MATTFHATYDGEVLRPEGPVSLPMDTRVRVTIEEEPAAHGAGAEKGEPYCFFRTALAARLEGPPDWSERFHQYVYGEGSRSDE